MGLDKWIKPEGTVKKTEKKEEVRSTKKPHTQPMKKNSRIQSLNLTKFVLICSKPKCKYKKTIVKKELTEKDHPCPRCKNVMKVQ